MGTFSAGSIGYWSGTGAVEKDFNDKAQELFNEDLQVAREWGVRGFPTIFFIDEEGNQFKVYGSKPYEIYEQSLLKLEPGAVKKKTPASYDTIINWYDSLTTKEFAVLNNKNLQVSEIILKYLQEQKQVEKISTKNGHLWKKIVGEL